MVVDGTVATETTDGAEAGETLAGSDGLAVPKCAVGVNALVDSWCRVTRTAVIDPTAMAPTPMATQSTGIRAPPLSP